jgi:hypothetical protein
MVAFSVIEREDAHLLWNRPRVRQLLKLLPPRGDFATERGWPTDRTSISTIDYFGLTFGCADDAGFTGGVPGSRA